MKVQDNNMNNYFIRSLFILLFNSLFIFSVFGQDDVGESPNPELQNQAEQIKKEILSQGPKFTLIGEITRGQSADYAINGEDFVIDSDARINGDLKIGAQANVRGNRIGDRNYAKKIFISDRSLKDPELSDSSSLDSHIGSGQIRGLPGQKLPE